MSTRVHAAAEPAAEPRRGMSRGAQLAILAGIITLVVITAALIHAFTSTAFQLWVLS